MPSSHQKPGLRRVGVEKAVEQALAAVNGEMDDEIDGRHPDIGRRKNGEDERSRHRVHRDMGKQAARTSPAAASLPFAIQRGLQKKIGDEVFEEENDQRRDRPGSRNHIRHTRPR